NVQDNCVIHCADELPTIVGANVTVGHMAMLEGCVIGEGPLVGMGAIVLQRARVGANALVAAGAVVGEGMQIPDGVLAAGVPAKVKKELAGSSQRWVEAPPASTGPSACATCADERDRSAVLAVVFAAALLLAVAAMAAAVVLLGVRAELGRD